VPNDRVVRTAGIVTLRQQPATAKGSIFVSLEDEFDSVRVMAWRSVREGQSQALLESRMLAVKGIWQRNGVVYNLIADRLVDLTPWLGRLETESRDFRSRDERLNYPIAVYQGLSKICVGGAPRRTLSSMRVDLEATT
jgi:error-prone DNA polymerase